MRHQAGQICHRAWQVADLGIDDVVCIINALHVQPASSATGGKQVDSREAWRPCVHVPDVPWHWCSARLAQISHPGCTPGAHQTPSGTSGLLMKTTRIRSSSVRLSCKGACNTEQPASWPAGYLTCQADQRPLPASMTGWLAAGRVGSHECRLVELASCYSTDTTSGVSAACGSLPALTQPAACMPRW